MDSIFLRRRWPRSARAHQHRRASACAIITARSRSAGPHDRSVAPGGATRSLCIDLKPHGRHPSPWTAGYSPASLATGERRDSPHCLQSAEVQRALPVPASSHYPRSRRGRRARTTSASSFLPIRMGGKTSILRPAFPPPSNGDGRLVVADLGQHLVIVLAISGGSRVSGGRQPKYLERQQRQACLDAARKVVGASEPLATVRDGRTDLRPAPLRAKETSASKAELLERVLCRSA